MKNARKCTEKDVVIKLGDKDDYKVKGVIQLAIQVMKVTRELYSIRSFIEKWLGYNAICWVFVRDVDQIGSEPYESHVCLTKVWDARKKCQCIWLQFKDLEIYCINKSEERF